MLYKVTPMVVPEARKRRPRVEGSSRGRRKTAVYDANGQEVLITLMCLKCRKIKPLAQFGLRRMADGAVRNQPWCRSCRSIAGSNKATADAAANRPLPGIPADQSTEPAASAAPSPDPAAAPSLSRVG